jgi:hypothetical protein
MLSKDKSFRKKFKRELKENTHKVAEAVKALYKERIVTDAQLHRRFNI